MKVSEYTLGLRSMHFTVGGDAETFSINDGGNTVSGLRGVYTISGGGTVSQYNADAADTWVATSGGVEKLGQDTQSAPSDRFVFTGSGWGHNVGMSQWGAVAMAEQGMDYVDILTFYYTGVDVY